MFSRFVSYVQVFFCWLLAVAYLLESQELSEQVTQCKVRYPRDLGYDGVIGSFRSPPRQRASTGGDRPTPALPVTAANGPAYRHTSTPPIRNTEPADHSQYRVSQTPPNPPSLQASPRPILYVRALSPT